ncbi:cysteine-rich motor neuron 1 protein-like isoform X2 [Physella acuta]|uniref:cysteine-rich motor neuron 1 protein-like isoform X2 n=1 Tax=Physella acuta TaxID=109671 RepID=UPI0027DD6FC4|nr:cysteine-rich motor neuron 1 protein-like isoform X2 [Physella acuta]
MAARVLLSVFWVTAAYPNAPRPISCPESCGGRGYIYKDMCICEGKVACEGNCPSVTGCERYQEVEKGCPPCHCLCYTPTCPVGCSYGVEYIPASDGCRECRCKSPCPGLCDLYCPEGFVLDASGCPACK